MKSILIYSQSFSYDLMLCSSVKNCVSIIPGDEIIVSTIFSGLFSTQKQEVAISKTNTEITRQNLEMEMICICYACGRTMCVDLQPIDMEYKMLRIL